ncbi:MAG: hypothetical protein GQ570_14690 [Helicobacteraceae bacterium]|nr:hypothetical protein [Helicobacteraceae bacterium]
MKKREFKIQTNEFETDFAHELTNETIEEYLYDELEVPTECIESLNYSNNYILIKLSKETTYTTDDWYVNLQRVS